MEFNQKLQELRKSAGLTQEELAAKLFVSRTAISKWESGRGYPSIESLKIIASFFSISLDELLSSREVLTIAEADGKRKENNLRDLVYGLLDLSMILLIFLPLFASKTTDGIHCFSLIAPCEIQSYLKVSFITVVLATALLGISTLALQNCQASVWVKYKTTVSLLLGAVAVLLFTVCSQPYAAVFSFVLLAIKAVMLIKRK